jgi:phage tail-like protein
MADPPMPSMPTRPPPPPRPAMPSMPPVASLPAAAGKPPMSVRTAAAVAKAGGRPSATPTPPNMNDPAVSIRFHLTFDHLGIGWWNSFEGLGMETAVMQLEEGGTNGFVHQLPTRLKYSNVKLSRPINEESHKVAAWFMDIAKVVTRNKSAAIAAVDGKNNIIARWELLDVVPVRWTGPSFSVDSPKMATESLEMAFHGFHSGAAGKGA